ncbi:hypothetical protein L6452_34817 [Arctium lappa]|uniref:Uncharacterized protein n=1 Tax=Arctium lappa TaxID=4217 RepID=A0ACB8YKS9_ARCLA|nr:hypothetical protein L6452_34817 [Arctium lappa]
MMTNSGPNVSGKEDINNLDNPLDLQTSDNHGMKLFTKNSKFVAQVDISVTASSSVCQNSVASSLPSLSPELCTQLMNLLNTAQTFESIPSAANFAGNIPDS